jgi:hypothetical protein
MKIALSLIDPAIDRKDLVEFLSANEFPLPVVARSTEKAAQIRIFRGAFVGPDNAAGVCEPRLCRGGALPPRRPVADAVPKDSVTYGILRTD